MCDVRKHGAGSIGHRVRSQEAGDRIK
jgi:hypothetical protein